jgi:hypothetical protein
VEPTSLNRRAVSVEHGMLGHTEHVLDARNRLQVVVNLSPDPVRATLPLKPGWALKRVFRGQAVQDFGSLRVRLKKNDGCVFAVTRRRRIPSAAARPADADDGAASLARGRKGPHE